MSAATLAWLSVDCIATSNSFCMTSASRWTVIPLVIANLLPQDSRVRSPRREGRVRGDVWVVTLAEKAEMKWGVPSVRNF
jgi:hypothetical protein